MLYCVLCLALPYFVCVVLFCVLCVVVCCIVVRIVCCRELNCCAYFVLLRSRLVDLDPIPGILITYLTDIDSFSLF